MTALPAILQGGRAVVGHSDGYGHGGGGGVSTGGVGCGPAPLGAVVYSMHCDPRSHLLCAVVFSEMLFFCIFSDLTKRP